MHWNKDYLKIMFHYYTIVINISQLKVHFPPHILALNVSVLKVYTDVATSLRWVICFCQVILNRNILLYLYLLFWAVSGLSAVMLVCFQALVPPSNDHFSVVMHRLLHVGVGWKSLKPNFLEHNVECLKTSLELFFRKQKEAGGVIS